MTAKEMDEAIQTSREVAAGCFEQDFDESPNPQRPGNASAAGRREGTIGPQEFSRELAVAVAEACCVRTFWPRRPMTADEAREAKQNVLRVFDRHFQTVDGPNCAGGSL